jgi:hypothetical protein
MSIVENPKHHHTVSEYLLEKPVGGAMIRKWVILDSSQPAPTEAMGSRIREKFERFGIMGVDVCDGNDGNTYVEVAGFDLPNAAYRTYRYRRHEDKLMVEVSPGKISEPSEGREWSPVCEKPIASLRFIVASDENGENRIVGLAVDEVAQELKPNEI